MARWTLSDQAERTLDAWLDGLQRGQIRLQDLPPSVAAFIHAGEAYGRASRQPEIDALNHQLDLLYLAAFNPKDRAEVLQRRLDKHFAAQAALFFAEPQIQGPAPHSERRAA